MIAPGIPLDTAFQALTDYAPLRWQRRLFEQLRSGQIPRVCDLPTGLGKTSVIPIWTIALARQAQEGPVNLPRRLVYIVNRRTVVDQATSVVERIRERLLDPDDARWSAHDEMLRTLARALQGLTSTRDELLAVSTLRGELADNEEWKADPARPAIIIGTIDMVGSKLLFSGYGDGRYWRAQHAGLVGQDSLIVHDEAHLTPAFSDLLRQVADVQRQAQEPRPVQVMELSATSRGGDGHPLGLEPEDDDDDIVRERLDAAKRLRLHEIGGGSEEKPADVARKRVQRLVELSLRHEDARAKVLIYVRSPEDAQKILDLLGNSAAKERIAILTGTIRGYERDKLVRERPVYRAFMDPDEHVDRTVYLVSTSAGEVGIDIDADHGVCDETTLDSMIQRLGRINRRGGRERKAWIDLVVQPGDQGKTTNPSEVDEAIKATQAILHDWATRSQSAIDVSPRSLRALLNGLDDERREKAFTPKPPVPLLTDILLDAWSLTTINRQMPGRPEVAAYLHGLTTDPPDTYVVWREEVALLHESGVDQDTLRDWFQACRVEARERLRDSTGRVKRTLENLLKGHRQRDERCDFPVVVLNERGEVEFPRNARGEPEWPRLSQILKEEFHLEYRTVVLPVGAGGLNEYGALDAKAVERVPDVGDQGQTGARRERWVHLEEADVSRFERLIAHEAGESLPTDLRERERVALQQPAEGAEDDGGSRYLVLLAQPRQAALERAETARTKQTLSFHLDRIAGDMNRISEALHLEPKLKEALELAARWHDRGKDRAVWQRYACNPEPHMPLAKSTKYLNWRALGGYRHELGSLLEAAADEHIRAHSEADLILHLIAAHHGWARPHFERNAWDNSRTTADNEEAAAEVMRRFGKLQRRFGRWGLAWLESLVRCADIAASIPDAASLDEASHHEISP